MTFVPKICPSLAILVTAMLLPIVQAGSTGFDPTAPYLILEDKDQEADYSAFSLEELFDINVVTASKHEESQWEAPGVVSVITAKEMEIFGANDLYDALERVPGLTNMFSLHLQRTVFRGGDVDLAYSHALLLIDGRPLRSSNGNFSMYSAFFTFPLSLIDRIEIVRGPGSVLYGTNAFEGVINIITKKKNDNDLVSVSSGSFRTKGGEVYLGIQKNDFSMKLGVHYFDTAGWLAEFDGLNFFTGNVVTAREDVFEDNVGINLITSYKGFTLSLYTGRHKKWEEFFFDPAFALTIHSDVDLYNLAYSRSFDNSWRIEANITNNKESYTNPITNRATDDHFLGLGWKSDDILAEVTAYRTIGDEKGTFLFGTVFQNLTGVDLPGGFGTYFEYDTTSLSAYFSFDYKINRFLKIIAGAQYNRPKDGKDDIVPRVGGIYNFSPSMGVKLLWGKAFRSPGQLELNVENEVQKGNPDLEPEKIATFDAQLFFRKAKAEMVLTYYNSKENNLIRAVPNDVYTIGEYFNIGELHLEGFEFETKVSPTPKWFLLGSISTQSNKDENKDEDLTLMPNTVFKAGVGYNQEWGSIAIFDTFYDTFHEHNLIGDSSDRYLNPNPNSFHMVNANFVFNVNDLFSSSTDLVVEVFANNLLDEEVWVPENFLNIVNSVPGSSGRAFYGTLKFRF